MLYVQLFFAAVSIFYTVKVEALPLTYQQCAERHVNGFRQDELEAARELLKSLVELESFPEMQEDARRSYSYGSELRQQHLNLALKISEALCTD
jgi:hypothetical protein